MQHLWILAQTAKSSLKSKLRYSQNGSNFLSSEKSAKFYIPARNPQNFTFPQKILKLRTTKTSSLIKATRAQFIITNQSDDRSTTEKRECKAQKIIIYSHNFIKNNPTAYSNFHSNCLLLKIIPVILCHNSEPSP